MPELIDDVIAKKHEALEHPDMLELYRIVNDAFDWPPDVNESPPKDSTS